MAVHEPRPLDEAPAARPCPQGHEEQPASEALGPLLAWVYLLLIAIAEELTLFRPALGLTLHAALLLGLLVHGTACETRAHRLMLALALAPLLRLLSYSLPLGALHRTLWYPFVMLPVAWAAARVARIQHLPPRTLGLRWGDLGLQLLVAPVGLGLGALGYLLLDPAPLALGASWGGLVVAGLVLLLCTGLGEEYVFRGLLQHLALRTLRHGLVYVALLYALLYVGQRSVLGVALALGVALLLGLFVRATASIVGASLAHGLANVTMLLVMPRVAAGPNLTAIVLALAAFSVVCALLAVGRIYSLARRRQTALPCGTASGALFMDSAFLAGGPPPPVRGWTKRRKEPRT